MRLLRLEPAHYKAQAQLKALRVRVAELAKELTAALNAASPSVRRDILWELNLFSFTRNPVERSSTSEWLQRRAQHLENLIEDAHYKDTTRRRMEEQNTLKLDAEQSTTGNGFHISPERVPATSFNGTPIVRSSGPIGFTTAVGDQSPQQPHAPDLDASLRPAAVALRKRLVAAVENPGKHWDEKAAKDALTGLYALLNVPCPRIHTFVSPTDLKRHLKSVLTNPPSNAPAVENSASTMFDAKTGLYSHCKSNMLAWTWRAVQSKLLEHASRTVGNTLNRPFWEELTRLIALGAVVTKVEVSTCYFLSDLPFDIDRDAALALAMIQSGIPFDGHVIFEQFDAFLELELQALEAGVLSMVEVAGELLICPMPSVLRDDRERLHSDEKPAVFWQDGSGVHYLRGVRFSEDLWRKVVSRRMSLSNIMVDIQDMEQRQQALYYADAERLLAETKAELLDTYDKKRPDGSFIHYALYHIQPSRAVHRTVAHDVFMPTPFPNGAWYVLYDDATPTGRKYLSGVPSGSKTVREAMASKFRTGKRRMTPEEWERMSPMTTES